VPPELIFDQGLGDLFVVRVAGNVTDPALLGSLEYAVEYLHTPVIVVLGHEECGAVKAAVGAERPHGNLGAVIQGVYTGKTDANGTAKSLDSAVKANVLHQVGQLTAKSTVIKEFADSQRIKIAAGVYSLKTGKIDWLDLSKK
jgi:carbonic anhydrase